MTPLVAELALLLAVAGLCWPDAAHRRLPATGRPRMRAGSSPGAAPVVKPALVLWLLVAVVASAVWWPLIVLVVAGGPLARHQQARAARNRRQRELTDSLPEALDICTVVVGAGGTIRDGVELLAVRGPAPVRPLAAEAISQSDAGQTFDQSLRWLQAALGPSFQPLTGALLLAQEQGGSVGLLLARLSAEASASRRRRGELRARRLPVVLLVPLVCCSLPAVIIGVVVPLAVVAFRNLAL